MNAYDTKDYTFSYALGAYDLEGDSSIAGGADETFKVIPEDRDDEGIIINGCNDLAVSIVLNTGAPSDVAGASGMYRAFRNPSQISVANIPLMNISYHGGISIGRMYVNNEYYDTATSSYVPQLIKWGDESLAKNPVSPKSYIKAFYAFIDPVGDHKIDFDEDIYFIYSYATDLE